MIRVNIKTGLGSLLAGLLVSTGAMAEVTAQITAITNAKVHTMGPQGVIDGATILIENGKIRQVGAGIDVPSGAVTIDANGRPVTPGIFDANSYFGVVEVSLVEQTVDLFQSGDRFTAAFELSEAINPRSTLIPINRIEGVTRAMVAPDANFVPELVMTPIKGLGTVIQLGSTSDYIVAKNAALYVKMGESGASLSGGSRGNNVLWLREALMDARDYAANRTDYDQGERREYSVGKLDLEALLGVLNGRRPLVAQANRASDIEVALRLADEFGIRLVILGGSEAWIVADKLAEARVPVILNPLENLPTTFEQIGATLENAARLNKAGVDIAFSTGDSHNARNLKQAAGVAVANGLPYDAALAAMTVTPARIFGLSGNYGTVEPGKEADLVIWSGDPLEVTTFADAVYIRGAAIPMVSRSTLLFERYKELDGDLPPAYRN